MSAMAWTIFLGVIAVILVGCIVWFVCEERQYRRKGPWS